MHSLVNKIIWILIGHRSSRKARNENECTWKCKNSALGRMNVLYSSIFKNSSSSLVDLGKLGFLLDGRCLGSIPWYFCGREKKTLLKNNRCDKSFA